MFGLFASLFALFMNNSAAHVGPPVQAPTGSGSTHTLHTTVVNADSSPSNDGSTDPGSG